jgi:hypothetical protein
VTAAAPGAFRRIYIDNGDLHYDETRKSWVAEGREKKGITGILRHALLLPPAEDIDPFYLNRGRAVHKACSLEVMGQLDRESLDEHVRPRFAAFCKFMAESQFTPVLSEQRAWTTSGALCILDLAGFFPGDPLLSVIDIKGLSPGDGAALQTAAQALALMERTKLHVGRRFALTLNDEQNYRLHPFEDPADMAVVECAITLYHYRRRKGLIV